MNVLTVMTEAIEDDGDWRPAMVAARNAVSALMAAAIDVDSADQDGCLTSELVDELRKALTDCGVFP